MKEKKRPHFAHGDVGVFVTAAHPVTQLILQQCLSMQVPEHRLGRQGEDLAIFCFCLFNQEYTAERFSVTPYAHRLHSNLEKYCVNTKPRSHVCAITVATAQFPQRSLGVK